MTHEPGHKTDPNYDKLPWKTKQRYDKMVEGGKHKDRPQNGDSRLKVNQE